MRTQRLRTAVFSRRPRIESGWCCYISLVPVIPISILCRAVDADALDPTVALEQLDLAGFGRGTIEQVEREGACLHHEYELLYGKPARTVVVGLALVAVSQPHLFAPMSDRWSRLFQNA